MAFDSATSSYGWRPKMTETKGEKGDLEGTREGGYVGAKTNMGWLDRWC